MTESTKDTEGASIINLSSIYGQIAGPIYSAYSASKGAVRMFTKAIASELGRMNTKIRVNSVHPGPTDTELGRGGLVAAEKFGLLVHAKNQDEACDLVATQFPMGRWGEVKDVSGAVAFLASDASSFVTGSELVVDGGYSIV